MKQTASENAAGLQPSLIRTVLDRGAALKAEGKPLIALSVGEPDFPTPAAIREACCFGCPYPYSFRCGTPRAVSIA